MKDGFETDSGYYISYEDYFNATLKRIAAIELKAVNRLIGFKEKALGRKLTKEELENILKTIQEAKQ